VTFHHHWLIFGAAFLIVIALLMIGVAVQEWWQWRRR
jgi:hypothetical protein